MDNNENIISELNLIALNVPEDLSPIEKVRWVYIKLGSLFSYDYNFTNKQNRIDFSSDYVSRYQTCVGISNILNLILNNIDQNIKCETITRDGANIRGIYDEKHVANLVTFKTGEKIIIDLTLDLYLIQSGCQTKEFGFTTSSSGEEDIVSLYECREMDFKMGIMQSGQYTDNKIQSVIDKLDFSNSDFENEIDIKMKSINSLFIPFKGFQESKNYINMLFGKILKHNYKEFNLKYNDKMISCFVIFDDDNEVWYLLDSTIGLVKTNPKNIKNMFDNGFTTRSNTIYDYLDKKNITR